MSQASPYSPAVRERWRHPTRRGELGDATAVAEGTNPLCGDRVRFQLRVRQRRIEAARHSGESCALCSAAADVIAERVERQPVERAGALSEAEVLEALAAQVPAARRGCVQLPLRVLAQALRGADEAP